MSQQPPTPPYGGGQPPYGGGQPPYGGGQPPYGGGQPPYGAPPPDHPKATTALVLGIIGIACCSPFGIAAAIVGNNAMKEIDASGGAQGGRGRAQAGKILGIIAMVFLVLSLIGLGLAIATGGFSFEVGDTSGY